MIIIDHVRHWDHHTLGLMHLNLRPNTKCAVCGEPDLCEAEIVRWSDRDPAKPQGIEFVCVECTNWYSTVREFYAPCILQDGDDALDAARYYDVPL
jgi:hypothetical protein